MTFPRVEGWKAIASYLGRSMRWCQMHAHELPVFRVGEGGHVAAYPDKLDEFLVAAEYQAYKRRPYKRRAG